MFSRREWQHSPRQFFADTIVPFLHSPHRKLRHGRVRSSHKTLSFGLNGGIEEDRVPKTTCPLMDITKAGTCGTYQMLYCSSVLSRVWLTAVQPKLATSVHHIGSFSSLVTKTCSASTPLFRRSSARTSSTASCQRESGAMHFSGGTFCPQRFGSDLKSPCRT